MGTTFKSAELSMSFLPVQKSKNWTVSCWTSHT